jgi:hypothetical protein
VAGYLVSVTRLPRRQSSVTTLPPCINQRPPGGGVTLDLRLHHDGHRQLEREHPALTSGLRTPAPGRYAVFDRPDAGKGVTADEREADVRIAGLDALEHVPLAVACCASAVFLLATGHTDPPPLDFLWPWAVAPPVGTVLAVVAVSRYRGRFRDDGGLRRYAGLALDGVGLLWKLARTAVAGRWRWPA